MKEAAEAEDAAAGSASRRRRSAEAAEARPIDVAETAAPGRRRAIVVLRVVKKGRSRLRPF